MKISHKIFILMFLSMICAFYAASPALSVVAAGTSIESQAELRFEYGDLITSEVTVIIADQMYGVTMEPIISSGYDMPAATHYFPHTLFNLGNGTDNYTFTVESNVSTETWVYSLIKDEDRDCIHDESEITTVENPLPLAEEAQFCFFLAMTVPSMESFGASREVIITVTSEGDDGGSYVGANGSIYGGPDTAKVTDTLTVESLKNIDIYRNDATGKIYIAWMGGNADIHFLETTFEASFALSSVEAYNVSSPYQCTIEAKDGKIRYYKLTSPGTSMYASRMVGKFDVNLLVGWNMSSVPFTFTSEASSHLNRVVGTQLTGGSLPAESDRMLSLQSGTWKQSYLKTGAGWQGTLIYFGPDKGAWVRILEGHAAGNMTYVGIVSEAASREITLNQGYNMVGTAYPLDVDLNASSLEAACTSGDLPADADRILCYDSGIWKQSYLKTGSGWVGTLTKLAPGKSYWIKKQGSTATWFYPKPY